MNLIAARGAEKLRYIPFEPDMVNTIVGKRRYFFRLYVSPLPRGVFFSGGKEVFMENKKSIELKAWITMLIIAVILVAIGLLLFVISGNGNIIDFFKKIIPSSDSGLSAGIITALVCLGVIVVGILILSKTSDKDENLMWTTNELVVGALCLALAYVLSCLKLYELPNGGTITPASMLPIFVFAYIYGPVKGLFVAFVYSLLQLTQGIYVVHWVQFLLDYTLGFTVIGASGFFRNSIIPGIVSGGLLRYLCSFLSGWLFFGEYAPEGQAPWLYSLLYNGSYMIPEILICSLICLIPAMKKALESLKRKQLLKKENAQAKA